MVCQVVFVQPARIFGACIFQSLGVRTT